MQLRFLCSCLALYFLRHSLYALLALSQMPGALALGQTTTVVNPWVSGALATKAGTSLHPQEPLDLSKQYPLEQPPDASELLLPPDL